MEVIVAFVLVVLAGFMNNFSGGGRFVQLPALFLLGNPFPIAELLGTNKLVSLPILLSNLSRVKVRRELFFNLLKLSPALLIGMFLAAISSYGFLHLEESLQVTIFLLSISLGFVASYIVKRTLMVRFDNDINRRKFCGFFILISFYEGVLGAGNGSILTYLIRRYRLKSLGEALQIARVLTIGLALGSLSVYVWFGKVDWVLSLPLIALLAVGDIIGNFARKYAVIPPEIGRFGDWIGFAASGWSVYLILGLI